MPDSPEVREWAKRQVEGAARIGLKLDPVKLIAAHASHEAVKAMFRSPAR